MPRHRGRKRKPGARTPSDRPSRAEAPKPYSEALMEKRKSLFAREDPSTGALVAGDPRQPLCTEAPLDVLLARRLITEVEHHAGWTYAILAWLRAGRPFARSQMAALHASAPPFDWEPPDEAHAASRYAGAFVALQAAGYMPLHAVVDVAQHQQSTKCSLAQLVAGLDALVRHFEREKRPRRAANDRAPEG